MDEVLFLLMLSALTFERLLTAAEASCQVCSDCG